MAQRLLKTTSLVCTVLLAACGGGSSDTATVNNPSPTVDISSANQQAVATEVSSNALQFTGSVLSASVLAIEVEDSSADSLNIRALIKTLRQQAHAQAVPVHAQAVAATISESENCAVSGTITQSYEDNNNSKEWDAGEPGLLTFTNCVMSSNGVKITGTVKDEFLSETPITTVDKFTFENLKVSKGAISSELVSGSMTLTESRTGSAGSFQSSDRYQTSNLKVKVTEAVKSENFTLNEDVSITQSAPDLTKQTITGSGSIQSNNVNINGQVTFDITTPIVISITEPVQATAGQMTISGSGGTALYISFATPNPQTATLQVKKDGQNVGTPKEVSVSTLLAGLNTPT